MDCAENARRHARRPSKAFERQVRNFHPKKHKNIKKIDNRATQTAAAAQQNSRTIQNLKESRKKKKKRESAQAFPVLETGGQRHPALTSWCVWCSVQTRSFVFEREPINALTSASSANAADDAARANDKRRGAAYRRLYAACERTTRCTAERVRNENDIFAILFEMCDRAIENTRIETRMSASSAAAAQQSASNGTAASEHDEWQPPSAAARFAFGSAAGAGAGAGAGRESRVSALLARAKAAVGRTVSAYTCACVLLPVRWGAHAPRRTSARARIAASRSPCRRKTRCEAVAASACSNFGAPVDRQRPTRRRSNTGALRRLVGGIFVPLSLSLLPSCLSRLSAVSAVSSSLRIFLPLFFSFACFVVAFGFCGLRCRCASRRYLCCLSMYTVLPSCSSSAHQLSLSDFLVVVVCTPTCRVPLGGIGAGSIGRRYGSGQATRVCRFTMACNFRFLPVCFSFFFFYSFFHFFGHCRLSNTLFVALHTPFASLSGAPFLTLFLKPLCSRCGQFGRWQLLDAGRIEERVVVANQFSCHVARETEGQMPRARVLSFADPKEAGNGKFSGVGGGPADGAAAISPLSDWGWGDTARSTTYSALYPRAWTQYDDALGIEGRQRRCLSVSSLCLCANKFTPVP